MLRKEESEREGDEFFITLPSRLSKIIKEPAAQRKLFENDGQNPFNGLEASEGGELGKAGSLRGRI